MACLQLESSQLPEAVTNVWRETPSVAGPRVLTERRVSRNLQPVTVTNAPVLPLILLVLLD